MLHTKVSCAATAQHTREETAKIYKNIYKIKLGHKNIYRKKEHTIHLTLNKQIYEDERMKST